MSEMKNILIVGASHNQEIMCSLFKRSQMSFIPFFAASLTAAKQKLRERVFDSVILDQIFPGIRDGGLGYSLIPVIRASDSKMAVVIIVTEDTVPFDGGDNQANFVFSKENIESKRFNEKFELVVSDVLAY